MVNKRTPKYRWVVVFRDATRETIDCASGWREALVAGLHQAIRRRGHRLTFLDIVEVQRHLSNSPHGYVYKAWKF